MRQHGKGRGKSARAAAGEGPGNEPGPSEREMPRLRTEYVRARRSRTRRSRSGAHGRVTEKGKADSALGRASATENVGYAVPGHAEKRQLKGGDLGGCGAA
ncbi:hypothetical protein GCM10010498_12720 [Streptomyces cavourensis]|nr:hypothetical protein GCM10010498_12720 [Streptomyces cavourensis]